MGHRITLGGEFGHETICRVSAVGRNVKDVKVGDRVYPYPILVTGDRKRAGTIGGFSEYIYCPCSEWEKSIYHIDDELTGLLNILGKNVGINGDAVDYYPGS